MQTNLLGRLRNTSLPLTGGLLPLFEAVVNSIHGIEELGDSNESGEIFVEIVRKTKQAQLDLDDFKKRPGPEALEDIIGFKVTDNGVGFNDENMESFETLDTDHKVTMGGRGVGRLLWLKAFKCVQVESVFGDLSEPMLRRFTFEAAAGVSNKSTSEMAPGASRHTTVHLDEFNVRYRENSRKTLQAIAESILEHCLWYFVRPGGAPRITVADEGETVSLDDLYEEKILVSEGTKLPLASIVVVEIKRPMRNDASSGEEEDPVEQAIAYLNRIRKGQVQTPKGRPIPESTNIPGFCYVLADITSKLRERCLIHHDLRWTHDHLGFFGYKQNCNAFVEVISFDQLVNAAKERNRAFFDKLGLPTN